MHYIGLLAC